MAKKGRRPWTWVESPPQPVPSPVLDGFKAEVEEQANELIDTVLRPRHIKPPPEDQKWNFIEDLYTKWHQNRYFYFCARYRCPGPNAISPTFESGFARLEHVGNRRFNVAYSRHTGQWHEVYQNLTLKECLDSIRDDAMFQP